MFDRFGAVMFIFALLAFLLIQGLDAFILIKGFRLGGNWPWIIIAVFIVANLPLPYVAWLVAGARQPPTWAALLIVRPFYAWQFNWICFLFLVAPLVMGARLGAFLAGAPAIFDWARYAAGGVIALVAVLSLYGLFHTSHDPELVLVEAAIYNLPESLDGYRVAQLSDNHVAWWNSREEFERVAAMVKGAKPDMLVVTGDMIDHNPDYVHAFADCLEGVKPRHGRFAIIGNHDVYTGREAVASRMEDRGFKMLRNEWVYLDDPGLIIAGYDDSGQGWTGRDPAQEIAPQILKSAPRTMPVMLLAHRPPAMEALLGLPVNLVLAGHTHGGQLCLPFGGPGLADLTFKHTAGLYRAGDMALYVTRGTGTVGWPFRLFCPPEVTILKLTGRPAH